MNWFESIIYGLISGLTCILPVSIQAHQTILSAIFGGKPDPLQELLIHSAILLALFGTLQPQIQRLLHERKLQRTPPKRRKRQPDVEKVMELRFLRTAAIVLALGYLSYQSLQSWRSDMSKTALMLLLNGILLYIPSRLFTGNKDARSMSTLDGVLLGAAGAFAILPGVSQMATISSVSLMRGASREKALHWALLLSIPTLTLIVGLDAFALITQMGSVSLSIPLIVYHLLSAAAAFGGTVWAIQIMRFLAVNTGYWGFSYYSWGAALFAFILYLSI